MDTICAAELFVCFYFLFIFYESVVVFLMLLLIDCMVGFFRLSFGIGVHYLVRCVVVSSSSSPFYLPSSLLLLYLLLLFFLFSSLLFLLYSSLRTELRGVRESLYNASSLLVWARSSCHAPPSTSFNVTVSSVTVRDWLWTSEFDVSGRQFLTSKVDPRTVQVKIFILVVDP